jgi:hypothetical protein
MVVRTKYINIKVFILNILFFEKWNWIFTVCTQIVRERTVLWCKGILDSHFRGNDIKEDRNDREKMKITEKKAGKIGKRRKWPREARIHGAGIEENGNDI